MEWISVEQYPPLGKPVWVKTTTGRVFVACRTNKQGKKHEALKKEYWAKCGTGAVSGVVAWMPLEAPPEFVSCKTNNGETYASKEEDREESSSGKEAVTEEVDDQEEVLDSPARGTNRAQNTELGQIIEHLSTLTRKMTPRARARYRDIKKRFLAGLTVKGDEHAYLRGIVHAIEVRGDCNRPFSNFHGHACADVDE